MHFAFKTCPRLSFKAHLCAQHSEQQPGSAEQRCVCLCGRSERGKPAGVVVLCDSCDVQLHIFPGIYGAAQEILNIKELQGPGVCYLCIIGGKLFFVNKTSPTQPACDGHKCCCWLKQLVSNTTFLVTAPSKCCYSIPGKPAIDSLL